MKFLSRCLHKPAMLRPRSSPATLQTAISIHARSRHEFWTHGPSRGRCQNIPRESEAVDEPEDQSIPQSCDKGFERTRNNAVLSFVTVRNRSEKIAAPFVPAIEPGELLKDHGDKRFTWSARIRSRAAAKCVDRTKESSSVSIRVRDFGVVVGVGAGKDGEEGGDDVGLDRGPQHSWVGESCTCEVEVEDVDDGVVTGAGVGVDCDSSERANGKLLAKELGSMPDP